MNTTNIVILTGAGISAESGIQTFRASDGLWHNHRIEEVATPEGFAKNPALVHEFYNARRQQLHDPSVQPNAAHLALAQLEREFPGNVLVVTQNVDDLHERAGSQNLIHMHGELKKIRCLHCGTGDHCTDDISTETVCKSCGKTGGMRPHIVWFHEIPLQMDTIEQALADCDLFISIGTSGNVYPAAGFVAFAHQRGAKTVELNLDPSNNSEMFDKSINGLASQLVPAFVAMLLNAPTLFKE
jgi:NAD-dependent deacetylase